MPTPDSPLTPRTGSPLVPALNPTPVLAPASTDLTHTFRRVITRADTIARTSL